MVGRQVIAIEAFDALKIRSLRGRNSIHPMAVTFQHQPFGRFEEMALG